MKNTHIVIFKSGKTVGIPEEAATILFDLFKTKNTGVMSVVGEFVFRLDDISAIKRCQ